MKKMWIVGLILVLLLPHLALAQGDQQYDQDGLSFTYPEGWFTKEDDEESEGSIGVDISNAEFTEESDDLFVSFPGVIEITVGAGLETISSGDFSFPTEADPTFMAGYMTGLYAGLLTFVAAFSGETAQLEYGPLEETTINDHNAASITLSDSTTKVQFIILDIDGNIALILAEAPTAEFDEWQPTIDAIAASVNYTP